jgi:hypothetical protein
MAQTPSSISPQRAARAGRRRTRARRSHALRSTGPHALRLSPRTKRILLLLLLLLTRVARGAFTIMIMGLIGGGGAKDGGSSNRVLPHAGGHE